MSKLNKNLKKEETSTWSLLKKFCQEKSKSKNCTYLKSLTMQFPESRSSTNKLRYIRNSCSANWVLPITRLISLLLTDTSTSSFNFVIDTVKWNN